jgi:two-component system cell cycle sensor histidine kinase/response regulator CckA
VPRREEKPVEGQHARDGNNDSPRAAPEKSDGQDGKQIENPEAQNGHRRTEPEHRGGYQSNRESAADNGCQTSATHKPSMPLTAGSGEHSSAARFWSKTLGDERTPRVRARTRSSCGGPLYGGSFGAAAMLARRDPIQKLPPAGRMRLVVPAGAFAVVAALVMLAAIIEAPLAMRLVLHSTLLALGAVLFACAWFLSHQERSVLDRERLARAALSESEEKFRTLVANVPGAVYRCADDAAWTMAFCSEEIEEITGFPASDFVGNTRRTYASVIHEDDRADVQAGVAAALAADLPFAFEYRVVRADGSVRWVYEKGQGIRSPAGDHLWLDGAIFDITERTEAARELRQSHTRLELAGLATGSAVYEWDLCTGDTVWTESMTSTFGYPCDAIEPSYDWWLAAVHPEERARVDREFGDSVSARDTTVYAHEYRFLAADGSWRHVLDRGVLVRDASGEATNAVGAMIDLTETKRLEEQLRQSQKLEAIGQLAGGVAHDFNNLLTAMTGYADFLEAYSGSDDVVKRNVSGIKAGAERAASLTRQLLAFTRQQVLEPQVLEVNRIVRGAHELIGRLIREDVVVSLLLDPAPARIKADPNQIEQVLVNLVLNARDAMPEGGEIVISTQNVQLGEEHSEQGIAVPAGDYVQLLVEDNGQGMDEEVSARAFEPFFTTKALGIGTGLGLSTVYGIVKQSGGFIFLESAPTEGTRARIYLRATNEEVLKVDLPQPTAGTEHFQGRGTILVVEDEELVRSVLLEALESKGYETVAAGTGSEALELAELHVGPIDLVLSDVVLPGLNGPEVARTLAATRPEARILFMSGYTDSIVLDLGGDGSAPLIVKPFSMQQLYERIEEVLDDPSRPADPGGGSAAAALETTKYQLERTA